jgi:hypothetical protein
VTALLNNVPENDRHQIDSRLSKLESIAERSQTFAEWQDIVENELPIKKNSSKWVLDESLYVFLREEFDLPMNSRLSIGEGRGLW